MKEEKNTRNVLLIVLGIMIVSFSVISFSYAYYISSSNTNTANYNLNSMTCLQIYRAQARSSRPTYFYPISDNDAMSMNVYAASSSGDTESETPFGQIALKIGNSCSEDVKVNIVFVPSSLNQLEMSHIRISSCANANTVEGNSAGGCTNPAGDPTVYQTPTFMSAHCYTTSSSPSALWQYLASTSIGGSALGGVDQRMCSISEDEYPNGITIPGNGYFIYVVRYWMDSTTTYNVDSYNGKGFAGKFVAYTI